MNNIARTLLLALTMTVCVSCAGEKRPEGLPNLVPCTIHLVQENAPLADAELLLMAEDASIARWAVTGKTDANGNARIMTMGKFAGAPVGDFIVLVNKTELVYKNPPREVNGDIDKGPFDAFSLVPREYENRDTSPLKVYISKNTKQIELDCGKKVRILMPKEAI